MEIILAMCSLVGTVFVFYVSKMVYVKFGKGWLSPIVMTPIIVITVLLITDTPYSKYNEGASILTNFLGPATVAFAVPIYKNIELLKKHATEIVMSIVIGSFVAMTTSFSIALMIGLDTELAHSLAPRSVTTPIAMDISNMIGGSPTLTAVFVMATGILGSLIAPPVIRACNFQTASAKGLMLGMGAHGTGTSKAFEFGEREGTFSSLAMVMAALISIVLSMTFFPAFEHFAMHFSLPLFK